MFRKVGNVARALRRSSDDNPAVINYIRFDKIAEIAIQTRKRQAAPNMPILKGIECTYEVPALSGSFNVVYKLEFSDGVTWMLKVPKAGYWKKW